MVLTALNLIPEVTSEQLRVAVGETIYRRAERLTNIALFHMTEADRDRLPRSRVVHEIAMFLANGMKQGKHLDDVHIAARKLIKSGNLGSPPQLDVTTNMSSFKTKRGANRNGSIYTDLLPDLEHSIIVAEVPFRARIWSGVCFVLATLLALLIITALLAFYSDVPS